jgi:hypothetical protein
MVQAIENWTSVAGIVRAVADDAPLDGYKRVAVEVEYVAPVAPFRSLIDAAAGEIMEIFVPAEIAGGLGAGKHINTRVRRGARGIFAHPDETNLD